MPSELFILSPCDVFPPVHGGGTRVRLTVECLQERHRLKFFLSHAYSRSNQQPVHKPTHPNLTIRYCTKTFLDAFGYRAILLNPFYFRDAESFMKHSQVDIIHCELLWSAFAGVFLKTRFKKPLLLVQHNVESLKFKQMGKMAYYRFLRKIERFCCEKADKIVVVSEVDKNSLLTLYNLPEDKISVVRNCVNPDIFKFNQQDRDFVRRKFEVDNETIVITFVGKLDYFPNAVAVKNIAEQVYPAIIKNHSKTKFLVVGDHFESHLRYQQKNLVFTGYVDDLPSYLSASDIVVAPIYSGSGTRLKTLEAASCSRPIVSTKKGVEGQDFLEGKEVLITEKVDENFIDAISRLIDDASLRARIGRNARKRIEIQYDCKKEMEKFDEIYQELSREHV
ncbi:MAG: glycosyltransferase family 4 protein [Candidatus Bathyarchaeota archaeon]|nr:MAG: glycosyltransferase family 4 protein [Candidatus Bathyarchaeota archaeon]